MSCDSDTASVLRAAGQKVTPQRLLILGCVRHAGGHVSAAQILEQVRAAHPYIDASTVYRTLAAAKERKLVSETKLGGGDNVFEWIESPHHHLICRVCGGVSELNERYLDTLAKSLQTQTGFAADLDHIAIFGTCGACQASA